MSEQQNAVEKNTERAHHPFSPSKLAMLEWCPCYESRNEANEAAIAGTMAHAITETGEDVDDLNDDHAAMAAECMDFFDRQVDLALEERNRAVAGLVATCKTDQATAEAQVPLVELLTETYLPVDNVAASVPVFCHAESKGFKEVFKQHPLEHTTGGYIDRAIIHHDRERAQIFDWKFGKWQVDSADENLQGIAYAVGMFRKYPSLKSVRVWFKQPALDFTSTHEFTRDDVPALYLRIQRVVEAKVASNWRQDFEMARPGIPACNFCARLGVCTKVCDFACKVGPKFAPLQMPPSIETHEAHDAKNTSLAMRLAQVVSIWAEAFKRQLTDRVLQGGAPVPDGYTIQQRADRKMVDWERAKAVTLQFLTEAELNSIMEFSRTAAGKIINAKAPRGTKTQQVEAYQKALVETGALVEGDPYVFLRVNPSRKDKETKGE